MKIKALLACLALVCGQAFATTYTWTDTVNPTPDRLITPTSPYVFTFDITDGVNGFRPFTDTVTSYSVTFNLYDDQDFAWETALIDLPGVTGDNIYFTFNGPEYGGESLLGFLQLNLFGQLTVGIYSIAPFFGDFFFGDATLIAHGVPEPSSMLLLGAALMATTLAGRRRKQ